MTQDLESPAAPLRLVLIVGSTRTGRFGAGVTRWFASQAAGRTDVEIDVVDLAEVRLEQEFPAPGQAPGPRTTALGSRLDRADAFVVVTPEYNHSFPAPLKDAVDRFRAEWRAKPVGFVSYGGMSGGLRAVEQLRLVFAELHATTVRDGVSFHNVWECFDVDGGPKDPTGAEAAAKKLLDQLAWWASALREARARRPYEA
ncbi:NAD(P)H-dependent FMN reductase [Streptomyces sp. cf386]|uniref:NADPH-dependent FMN reductase n=1 Tax=Streptomyces sp. cf386 TaxID=1761904 RepID=UPI0008819636|nr:NAD(P)H-dependent oxidoreductase [Streptomyces sp. cf386]SDP00516.1 NAD(P)H-dependent FMN reductase [Streptomyces sp. cf386]